MAAVACNIAAAEEALKLEPFTLDLEAANPTNCTSCCSSISSYLPSARIHEHYFFFFFFFFFV
jgi:hypothetical protein